MNWIKILYWFFWAVIALIALLLLVSIFPITGNIKFMIVQSGSMEPAIKTGSIIMTIPSKDYEIGDVILFGEDTKTKTPTTHRIHDIEVIEKEPYYITKGDANNAPDQEKVKKEEIMGKVLLSVPYLGYAINFIKKPIGFLLIIIIPAALIIFDEIKKIYQEVKKIKKDKQTTNDN